MNIHQVSVTYVTEQDRILLRINTRRGEEMRLWLTRRLMLGFMPVLNKTAADQMKRQATAPELAPGLDKERERMVESFKKEAAAYQGDYTTPYQSDGAALPLGSDPLLVTEVKLTLLGNAQLQLQMVEKLADKTRNLEVSMEAQLTQGLLHLLNQALKNSQWLEPPASSPQLENTLAREESTLHPESNEKPKYLN